MSSTTVSGMFNATVQAFGSNLAIRHTVPREGVSSDAKDFSSKFEQVQYTWQQYSEQASQFAKALIACGVKSKNRSAVTIQGSNSPRWLFANLGAILANAISAGVYPTNNPELSKHAAISSGAKVVVVEDEAQLKKYEGLKTKVISYFVVMNAMPNSVKKLPAKVITWDAFLQLGTSVSDDKLQRRIAKQKAEDVCSLIFTSGTTGMPKAAALTHGNLLNPAKVAGSDFQFTNTSHGINYLPLSHIAPQQLDCIIPITYGSSIDIAPSDALKGTNLRQHIEQARPTYFLAVPRVWEKFKEVMDAKLAQAPWHERMLFQVASTVGKKASDIAVKAPEERSYVDVIVGPLANTVCKVFERIVFGRVKKALGLDKCQIAASGAGSLDPQVRSFFAGLNIRILDVYGMSETSGLVSYGGKLLSGTEVKIGDDGEILVKGDQIFKEYWKNPEATAQAFDQEQFLRTGDMGTLVQGKLAVTGRLKELIKTSGGENIPPVRIEGRILAELPILSQAIVVGDKRNFLTCLVTLKTEPDSNKLAQELKAVTNAQTVEEAMKDGALRDYIQAGIKRANTQADSEAQRVQKFTLLQEDCTVANGLMTPTLKLRRHEIVKRYDTQIAEMYA